MNKTVLSIFHKKTPFIFIQTVFLMNYEITTLHQTILVHEGELVFSEYLKILQ